MLPTFLIIGTQKGGTTSLYELLAEHPEVGRASLKEAHYFDQNHDRPISWYQAHFPRRGSARHTGEATPYYLFHPLCAERVHAALPKVKLIVLLRNPVDRAHSHHNHEHALGNEELDFVTAIAQEPERLAGEERRLAEDPTYQSFAHQHYSYVARGLYAEQLKRWYDRFPPDQILTLASEEFFADPEAILHRVQTWLELATHTPARLTPRNARSYDPMDPELRARLAGYFRADTAQLPRLTNTHLPWAQPTGS
jgi:hypothetical protein